MIKEIKESTEKAEKLFKKSKIKIQVKALITRLNSDIEDTMRAGDWEAASRLAFYRHEFLKTYENFDWYKPYLEIRKTRDMLNIILGK